MSVAIADVAVEQNETSETKKKNWAKYKQFVQFLEIYVIHLLYFPKDYLHTFIIMSQPPPPLIS